MRRALLTFLSLAGTTQIALAQTDADVGTMQWFLDTLPAQAPADSDSAEAQRYSQMIPMAGRDDLWLAAPRFVVPSDNCELDDSQSGSAQARITALARNTQLVIINEAHDTPWHRQLTESLLGPLWDEGYRYLAAEAFSDLVNQYPDESFGRLSAGSWTVDPTFGSLIRTAKQLGFKLVAYEAPVPPDAILNGTTAEQIAYREEVQANNIVENIFAGNPEAMVIVHVGYSHAAEVPVPSFNQTTMPWMAARLKEKTGIDPLTIDQTYCRSETSQPVLARPTRSMPRGTFDLAIAYPEIETERGRAVWRLTDDMRFVELPGAILPENGRAIVEARLAAEPDDAIPLDRLLLNAGESLPLVLPAGELRLTILHEATGAREVVQLTVE